MGSDHSKKQPSSEDFLMPVRQSGLINNQVYERGKAIVDHIQKKQWNQIHEYFNKRQIKVQSQSVNGHACLRQTKKQEAAYECLTCQYIEGKYYCSECFQKESHKQHNYRVVEGKRLVCQCGNDQVMDQTYFCNKHNKSVPILPSPNSQFQKQAKFFIELLLFLKQDPKTCKTFKLWPQSIEILGEPLLRWLLNAATSADGKVTVAQALLNKMEMLSNSEIKIQSVGKTLLEGLIVSFYKHTIITNLLIELINQLFWTGLINKQLLRIHYKVMLLGDFFDVIPNILQKLNHDYTLCFKNQMQYFSDKSNARVFFNRSIPPNRLQLEYSIFFDSLSKLLKFRHSSKMISNIVSETPFSKMFNFHFSDKAYSQPIAKLAIPAFYLAKGIIKVVEDKALLKAIIFNTLQTINKKEHFSVDFIFQRSFALALYQYFDFTLPNASQLKQFFSQEKLNPRQLILRFWQAKDYSLQTYNQHVLKNEGVKGCPSLTVLCTDQLYLKILCSLLTSKEEVTALYKNFGERVLGSPVEGLQQIKAKIGNVRILKMRLHQIATFISLLGASLNSNIAEIVLRGCQNNNKQSIDELLSFLAVVFEGSIAADFKDNAQRFVQEQQVVAFIKEKLFLQGKKIRCKTDFKHNVGALPFSDFFSSLAQINIDRMMACKWQNDKQHRSMFIDEQCLRHLMVLLYACLVYLDENSSFEGQVQEELQMVLRSVLAFSAEKKNKEFISLVYRIHSRINSCPNDLDSFARRVMESDKVEDNSRNNKKKLKMQQLKAKQKNMLQALQVQQELQISAQCIVCKNSKPGNPSLLGHFGYKNIFSGVLKAETPFLEFSSCGHYIHQECLQESHKNQFKIWYPCILCKTISNILLPSVKIAPQEEDGQLLQRVLTFLKNLGGIYTFFYQDRKELVQFNLDNVEGVFPLLFKTLAYQITFYPLINLAYFQRSQLPVTRFLFDLLQFTSDRLKGVTVVQKIEVSGEPFFVSLYNYVAEQLSSVLKHQGHRGAGSQLPVDVIVVVQEIIYMLSKQDEKMEISQKDTKSYREAVVTTFKAPPLDLKQLQSQARICASCQKQVQNYEMCVLCAWACCVKCSEVKKVHALQSHLSESVFIRNANGKCSYVHEQLLAELPSLYCDYLGQQYTRTERAVMGEYGLSASRWEGVVQDLLNNRIHREIMKHQ